MDNSSQKYISKKENDFIRLFLTLLYKTSKIDFMETSVTEVSSKYKQIL